MNKLLQGHDKILSKSSSLKNIISQLENHIVLYNVGRTIVLFKSMGHGMSANNLQMGWKNLTKTYRKYKIKTFPTLIYPEYFYGFMYLDVFVFL